MDLAGWRIFVANGFRDVDAQEVWMARDMARTPRLCTMAIWHSPLFTSNSEVVPSTRIRLWWKMLYTAGADVVIGGHAHDYERFARVTPFGVVDLQRGIREFVIGTGGGGGLFSFLTPHLASRSRIVTWGILKLTLWPNRYRWQFIDLTGTVRDSGAEHCH